MIKSELEDDLAKLLEHFVLPVKEQMGENAKWVACYDEMFNTVFSKYTTYLKEISDNLTAPENMDTHKCAACLCGAVIDSRLLVCTSEHCSPDVNEYFGIYVGLNIIRESMIASYQNEFDKETLMRVNEIFQIGFPKASNKRYKNTNHDFLGNWIANIKLEYKCPKLNELCHRFDIWNCSMNYFHIEIHNRQSLISILNSIEAER